MVRLLHGAILAGYDNLTLTPRDIHLGLISALMHDTGYIQRAGEREGTGAKYTKVHVQRSIDFLREYFSRQDLDPVEADLCATNLRCTGLDVRLKDLTFANPTHLLIGNILGTADLIGQMADRNYLEKLTYLFHEFKEAGIPGYANELDLLSKSGDFLALTKQRFRHELGNVAPLVRHHFRVRWGIDRDLYMAAIENNIQYLADLLRTHPADYQTHLRRRDRSLGYRHLEAGLLF
jgi:hypothetical protein